MPALRMRAPEVNDDFNEWSKFFFQSPAGFTSVPFCRPQQLLFFQNLVPVCVKTLVFLPDATQFFRADFSVFVALLIGKGKKSTAGRLRFLPQARIKFREIDGGVLQLGVGSSDSELRCLSVD